MLSRDPRLLAFFMMAAGLGLAGWYGLQWYELPARSPAQVTQIVELRLASELEHRGPLLPLSGDRLELLRSTIRAEVEAEIRRERQVPERWLGIGLVLCVFGAGQWVLSLARKPQ